MANLSIFATNSTVGTNSITGSPITAYTNSALVPYAGYDMNSDTVCGVPVWDWNHMSQDEQIHYARKWEEHRRQYERDAQFPREQKVIPVKADPTGYLSNTKLLLLEI
jgi:hypothetical protein